MSCPIIKHWHMVRKMKLKHNVIYENILDKFNVGHCGIKVNVTFAPAKFNHSIFFNQQQMALHYIDWLKVYRKTPIIYLLYSQAC